MTFASIYQSGHLVLPSQLLFHQHQIFASSDDFLVWQFYHLQQTTTMLELLPSQIAQALGKSVEEVNRSIERLTEKKLLVMKTIQVAGDIETIFDPSPAFERLDDLLGLSGQSSVATPPQEVNLVQELVAYYEENIGRLIKGAEFEELKKVLEDDKMEAALVREAIKRATLNGKYSWNYINAILRNWRTAGLLTLRQVQEREQQQKQKEEFVLPSDLQEDFKNMMTLLID